MKYFIFEEIYTYLGGTFFGTRCITNNEVPVEHYVRQQFKS